jgi:hypothetical protein
VYNLLLTVIMLPEAVKVFCVYFSGMENSDSQDLLVHVFNDALPMPKRKRLEVLAHVP